MSAGRLGGIKIVVGIDLVQVSQVARSVAQLGENYTSRIWTAAEIARCNAQPAIAPARFAASFAAKAATLKALRLGDAGLDLRTIEVTQGGGGAWELELHGRAGELAAERNWQSWSVSLSEEGDYATAVVTALTGNLS